MFESIKDEAIWLALLGLLCGCSTKPTATGTATDAAKAAVDALEEGIKGGCASTTITKQISAIRTQISTIQVACEADKKAAVATEQKKTWYWRFACAILGALLLISLRRKTL